MAEEAKTAGNEAMKSGDYADAISKYTSAINLNKTSGSGNEAAAVYEWYLVFQTFVCRPAACVLQ